MPLRGPRAVEGAILMSTVRCPRHQPHGAPHLRSGTDRDVREDDDSDPPRLNHDHPPAHPPDTDQRTSPRCRISQEEPRQPGPAQQHVLSTVRPQPAPTSPPGPTRPRVRWPRQPGAVPLRGTSRGGSSSGRRGSRSPSASTPSWRRRRLCAGGPCTRSSTRTGTARCGGTWRLTGSCTRTSGSRGG